MESKTSKDDNGIKITYAHINKALRKLAKIDTNTKVIQYYSLPSSIETLNHHFYYKL